MTNPQTTFGDDIPPTPKADEVFSAINEFVYRRLGQITATDANEVERKELADRAKDRLHFALKEAINA